MKPYAKSAILKIILILIVCIPVLIGIIGFGLGYLHYSCNDTSTGWECKFNYLSEDPSFPVHLIGLLANSLYSPFLDWKCDGRYIATKLAIGWPYATCDNPYSDAGKLCYSSSQCEGLCILPLKPDGYTLKEINKKVGIQLNCNDYSCNATCATFRYDECWDEFHYYLDENSIIQAPRGRACGI